MVDTQAAAAEAAAVICHRQARQEQMTIQRLQ